MSPGWKIYWRSAGDAGFPPSVAWAGSENLAEAVLSWPAPRRFHEFDTLYTNGYKDEVVLPVRARARRADAPLALRATIEYATCRDICIPVTAHLALALAPGPAAPSPHSGLVARYLARVPKPPEPGGLTVASATVVGAGADRLIEVTARAPERFHDPALFVEGPGAFYFGAPETEVRGETAVFRVPAPAGRDEPALTETALTLTLTDGERAVATALTPVAGGPGRFDVSGFLVVLAIALLGGLVLNLMPCVLPVLSLKLMGIVGLGGAERRAVRRRFLGTAAGILATFLGLAAVLAGVKLAGREVGWGMQFQEPLFLVAMIVILALFAYNLAGLYEIRLPARLAALTARGGRGGLAGDVLAGAFATLLATPCSAPFVGTAIGFALARGPGQIVAIFAALGAGMALPYLAVAAAPGLVRRLPRPGPWMVVVRRGMGVLLAATALWLLTILAAEAGAVAATAVGALLALAGGLLALERIGGRWRAPALAGLVAVVGLAFVAPGELGRAAPEAGAESAPEGLWQPFDAAAIPGLVAAGKIVFVDVTAEWCITCKVNKATVLEREPVASLLAADGVVAMRADWTSPDPAIAAYLESFGRFGIPFDAVYGPTQPKGLALPELLTDRAVLAAVDRAGGARLAVATGD